MVIETSRIVTTGGIGDEVSIALTKDDGSPVIVKKWRGRDQLMEGLRFASVLQTELLAAMRECDERD